MSLGNKNTSPTITPSSSHSERPVLHPHLLFSLRYTIFALQPRFEDYVQEVEITDNPTK